MERPWWFWWVIAALLAIVALFGLMLIWPELDDVQPRQAYPGQLLQVTGGPESATGKWRSPSGGELTVPSTGPWRYVQVPHGAVPGVHQFSLNLGLLTSVVDITVLDPKSAFPPPRIEDVAIREIALAPPGAREGHFMLFVSASNLDMGARVSVEGKERPSTFFSGLPIQYMASHQPDTFEHPIYHLGQLAVLADPLEWGTAVNVTVTNVASGSSSVVFDVPPSSAEIDSDGDGLPNAWESGGTEAPGSAYGCQPLHADILLEVDWMRSAVAYATAWSKLESAFANAPVLNPDGTPGIRLLVDRGQGGALTGGGQVLEDFDTIDFGPPGTLGACPLVGTVLDDREEVSLDLLKKHCFDPARLSQFHYCVIGFNGGDGVSGRAEPWGNDFFVAVGGYDNVNWSTATAQAGTFMHELGHNLGLDHGGIADGSVGSDTRRKPNLPSVMNYRYQASGISTDCDFNPEHVLTYSHGCLRPIREDPANEVEGLCDKFPLDLNGDGNITIDVAVDADGDTLTTSIHADSNQWGALRLAFNPLDSD